MDETKFDRSLKTIAEFTGRRDALRSLGAAGMAALATLGIASGEAKKNRGNGGNHHQNDQRARAEKKGGGGKRGPTGPTGPTGPAGGGTGAGATGPTGPTGPAASSLPKVKLSDLVQASLEAIATVDCDAGWHAIGGGHAAEASSGVDWQLRNSFPTSDGNNVPRGWQVKVTIAGAVVGTLGARAYVICEPD
jgi:hypothetical protein